MLHDYLTAAGSASECEITLVLPFDAGPAVARHLGRAARRRSPSAASVRRRARRSRRSTRPRRGRPRRRQRAAVRPLPRRPEAPRARGRGRERPDRGRLGPGRPRDARDAFPGVYAIGESPPGHAESRRVRRGRGAGRRATLIVAKLRGTTPSAPHAGTGSCYIEFGAGRIARVDVDFLSGPSPTGTFQEPSGGAARREGAVRLEPPRPLVRPHDLRATIAWTWTRRRRNAAGRARAPCGSGPRASRRCCAGAPRSCGC